MSWALELQASTTITDLYIAGIEHMARESYIPGVNI